MSSFRSTIPSGRNAQYDPDQDVGRQWQSILRKLTILKIHFPELDDDTIARVLTQACHEELGCIISQMSHYGVRGPMRTLEATQISSEWEGIRARQQEMVHSVQRLHSLTDSEVGALRILLGRSENLNAERPREIETGRRGARRTLPPRQEPQYHESDRQRRDAVRGLFSGHRSPPMPHREPNPMPHTLRSSFERSTETLPVHDNVRPLRQESPYHESDRRRIGQFLRLHFNHQPPPMPPRRPNPMPHPLPPREPNPVPHPFRTTLGHSTDTLPLYEDVRLPSYEHSERPPPY